jgi:anti-anti-sigma factor
MWSVVIRGELDVTGAAEAEAAIAASAARGRYLAIDMSALDFLDCAALGALRRVRALARRGGGDVVLAAPRPLVRLLALTGSDEVLRSGQRGCRRCGHRQAPQAVLLAAACGAQFKAWEGGAIAHWYRVIAAGAAASLEGSLRGRVRR